MKRTRRCLFALLCATALCATTSKAENQEFPVFSHYGGVGLIKTRSARMAPDTTLSAGVAWHNEQQRYSLNFQAAPWLETTFSYSGFENARNVDTFDRQFDLKVRLWEEGLYLPEVAIGLQDFLGTGLFSGEYLVANKRFGPLDLSLGVGWGRLGSRADFDNPLTSVADRFKERDTDFGEGGNVELGKYFHGESMAVFGGVVYDTPLKGLRLIAEYNSDDNSVVNGLDDSPFNFGLTYNPTPGIQLGASYLANDEIAVSANFSTEAGRWVQDRPPGKPAPEFHVREATGDAGGGKDGLVAPVQPLIATPLNRAELPEVLRDQFRAQGLALHQVQMNADTVRVVIDNDRYRSYAKAAGRAVRILSRYAPNEIEFFQIAIDQNRLQTAEFRINRSQLEASAAEIGYSMAPPALSFAYITPGSMPVAGDTTIYSSYPDFDWSIGPDLRLNTFDPDDPLRFQVDLQLDASVEILPGLVVSGTVSKDIFGNFDDDARESNSELPKVRSDFKRYNEETDIAVERLKVDYFRTLGPNLYGKVSAGLLERMFGGVGGEILYRPTNSRLAYGANLYYVKQRGFDTLFSFQDYDVVTGHASVYYDTNYNNWNLAVHAGRYLAGDYGATFEVNRRFPNGWEVGAFATFTDVPFDEFGEGSFDKGITIKIPFDWGLPRDTKSAGRLTLRPLQRDGGQRLRLGESLFDLTQPTSRGEIASQWATFAH